MTGNQFFRLNYVDFPLNKQTMADHALIASMPAAAPAAAPIDAPTAAPALGPIDAAIRIQRKFRWWKWNAKFPLNPDITPGDRWKIKTWQDCPDLSPDFIVRCVMFGVPITRYEDYLIKCVCIQDKNKPFEYFLGPLDNIPRIREVENFFKNGKWTWIKKLSIVFGMDHKGAIFSKSILDLFFKWNKFTLVSKRAREEREERAVMLKLELRVAVCQRKERMKKQKLLKLQTQFNDAKGFNTRFQQLKKEGNTTKKAMQIAKDKF